MMLEYLRAGVDDLPHHLKQPPEAAQVVHLDLENAVAGAVDDAEPQDAVLKRRLVDVAGRNGARLVQRFPFSGFSLGPRPTCGTVQWVRPRSTVRAAPPMARRGPRGLGPRIGDVEGGVDVWLLVLGSAESADDLTEKGVVVANEGGEPGGEVDGAASAREVERVADSVPRLGGHVAVQLREASILEAIDWAPGKVEVGPINLDPARDLVNGDAAVSVGPHVLAAAVGVVPPGAAVASDAVQHRSAVGRRIRPDRTVQSVDRLGQGGEIELCHWSPLVRVQPSGGCVVLS